MGPRILLYMVGILGQGVLLPRITGLPLATANGVLAAAVALSMMIGTGWRRLPSWLDMPMAMLSLGGLGMCLGGWVDLRGGAQWCQSGAPHPIVSWMSAGMLLLGIPAMRWLRRNTVHCSLAACLLAIPWMVLGMRLGSRVADLLAPSLSVPQIVLTDYALMNLGMLLGMLVGALPRSRTVVPMPSAREDNTAGLRRWVTTVDARL